MIERDRKPFTKLVTDVHAFYRQDCSPFALSVWFEAMKPYDLGAVQDAFSRHAVNPDNGQFMPKPADLVRLMQGSTLDSAMQAWSRLDYGVRCIGTYASVCFDDPIINAVINDMGGWLIFGSKKVDEWPFVSNEFVKRYRSYKNQGAMLDWPKHLPGRIEMDRRAQGYTIEQDDIALIGDHEKALAVLLGSPHGSRATLPQLQSIAKLAEKVKAK